MEIIETPDERVSPENSDEFSGNGDSPNPTSVDEFNRRVESIITMMDADPRVRDRVLAELYVNFANVEMMFRGMTEMLQKEGPSAFIKGLMKRGKHD